MKAIELDPNNGLAYAELAQVQYKWEWDSTAARQSFQKAIQLSPGNWSVHDDALWFYMRVNDCESLEKEKKILLAMGESAEKIIYDYFLPLCRNNENQISKLNAEKYSYSYYSGIILMHQERYQECIEYLTRHSAIRYHTILLTNLGEAYALSGDLKMAEQTIKELNELSSERYVSKVQIAAIYLALGKKEMAFELLEQALKENDAYLRFMKELSVSIYRIRDDPRFMSIMERSWIPRTLEK